MIHPTAIVSDSATIADDVTIGPYSIIENDVVIGSGCTIESHVVVRSGTELGRNNHLFQFCSIGDRAQHLSVSDDSGRLVIGDDNVFREYCTISRGFASEAQTTLIGSNNLINAYCHFGHDAIVGDNNELGNDCQCAGHVQIGDYVTLGSGTLIHQFCRIGSSVQSSPGSVIIHDVPAFVWVSGEAAKARSINTVGLKRRQFNPEQRANIKRAFRVLCAGTIDADEIRTQCGKSDEIELFIQSVSSSDRGIIDCQASKDQLP